MTGAEQPPRPGRWINATHKTWGGHWQIRERADGDYDAREIRAKEPITHKVPAGYIRAEFVKEES